MAKVTTLVMRLERVEAAKIDQLARSDDESSGTSQRMTLAYSPPPVRLPHHLNKQQVHRPLLHFGWTGRRSFKSLAQHLQLCEHPPNNV